MIATWPFTLLSTPQDHRRSGSVSPRRLLGQGSRPRRV